MAGAAGPRVAARGTVRRTVLAAALSTVLASLPVFLLGGLAVLVRADLGFDEVRLGLAVSAFFTAAALGAVPAGRVAARLGAWSTTVLAAVLSALAMLGMAAAPGYGVLLVALGVAGLANALAQIGSNQSLAQVVRAGRQGLAFGVKQSAVPAATLLAGLALPLVGLTVGWRGAFAGAAVLALLYPLLAPRPVERPAAPPRRARGADAATGALVVVGVAAALGSAAANALGAFLVESAVATGVDPGPAGLLLGLGSALGIASRLGVGWSADRRTGGHLLVVAAMLGSGAVGMGLLAAGSVPLLVPGTLLAFGLGWSWPGLLNYAVVRLNPGSPAQATSITQTGVFAGGASGPLLFGLLLSATSYPVAWAAAGGCLLAASGLMLLGRRLLLTDRGRREAGAPADVPGVAPAG